MNGDETYSFADLVRASAERIRWESELGTPGYVEHTEVSVPAPVPSPAAPVTPEIQRVAAERTPLVLPGGPEPHPPEVQTGPPPTDAAPAVSLGTIADPGAALEALHRAMGDCTRCELHRGRTNVVFGEGDPEARLVFVGEGPGRDEDAAGRPFVGAAGQLLDRIIEAMGLRRDRVFICNVVKCRPPNNRNPEEAEANICGQFLRRQLAVIRPEVIVALGKVAAAYLLGGNPPISRVRGRFHEVDGLRIMPTYHPAFLLRNPGEKRAVWNDMQTVMQTLGLQAGKK